ncbi:hypothetical protein Enr13x_11520 [Stieleria neptunia]|uniref:Uncharacterized protein n=1 Tax=Stieleria neptunia TaxID=2527979 RepID=A0A518HKD8_9BACT|nr:hypothetical protein Enr13x_11520 [Stieleria neptunia]
MSRFWFGVGWSPHETRHREPSGCPYPLKTNGDEHSLRINVLVPVDLKCSSERPLIAGRHESCKSPLGRYFCSLLLPGQFAECFRNWEGRQRSSLKQGFNEY